MKGRSGKEEDLRATSESLRDDGTRLAQLEDMKLQMDPSDKRVAGLSDQIEHLTSEIADKAKAERELAYETTEQDDARKPD